MIYLLIKVCVNKGLIRIKSIYKTLKISYHNAKVGVYLRGGVRFESCPMHVINVLIYYLFIYLYISKSDILFNGFLVVCGIHYDTRPLQTRTSSGMCRISRFLMSVFTRSFLRFSPYVDYKL